MNRRILLAALVVAALVACRAEAQTYNIKLKVFPDVGKSVAVTEVETTRISITASLNGKALKEDKKTEAGEKQFTEKVVEGGARPKKYTRTYTKATKDSDGAKANLSYAGKTMVFEKQGDKYVVTAEGGGVSAKDLDTFTKNANKPDIETVLVPKNAVKVGDSWSLTKEVAAAMLGDLPPDAVDLTKVQATGKLVKAYKKGSQQFGVIELNLTLPLKKFGPIPLDKAIDMKILGTFDCAIDGSSNTHIDTATMSLKGISSFTQNNMTFDLDIAINGDFRRQVSAEK